MIYVADNSIVGMAENEGFSINTFGNDLLWRNLGAVLRKDKKWNVLFCGCHSREGGNPYSLEYKVNSLCLSITLFT